MSIGSGEASDPRNARDVQRRVPQQFHGSFFTELQHLGTPESDGVDTGILAASDILQQVPAKRGQAVGREADGGD